MCSRVAPLTHAFVAALTGGTSFALAGGFVPAGATCEYRLPVTANGTPGTVTNPSFVVTSSQPGSPVINTMSSAAAAVAIVSTPVTPATKAFDTAFEVLGQYATMTVTIPNAAGAVLTEVQFSDTGECLWLWCASCMFYAADMRIQCRLDW